MPTLPTTHVLIGHPDNSTLDLLDDPARTTPGQFAVLAAPEAAARLRETLTTLVTLAPWLPLCLMVNHRTVPVLQALKTFPLPEHFHPAILHYPALSSLQPHLVLQSIHGRPTPPIADLANWIAARRGAPKLRPLLEAAMAPRPADESETTDRQLRRQLAQRTPLARREWRRLTRLALLPRPRRGTVEASAGAFGTGIDSYRTWIRRLLGVSRQQYETLPGWEPVLELALRHRWPPKTPAKREAAGGEENREGKNDRVAHA